MFQKNVRKEDIFSKFSNNLFPTGCGKKMILGPFLDTPVHFLKMEFRNFGQVTNEVIIV